MDRPAGRRSWMKEEEVTLFSGNPPMCRRTIIIGATLTQL